LEQAKGKDHFAWENHFALLVESWSGLPVRPQMM
jgi:hypothetical protein